MKVLSKGFARPAIDAAHVFRSVMNAMARPGTAYEVLDVTPPAGLSAAAASVALTLLDRETPLYLAAPYRTAEIENWLTFHTNAPFCAAEDAMFALGPWDALLPLTQFPVGTPEYPDRSTTLIVDIDTWDGAKVRLSGPGLKDPLCAQLPALEPLQLNAALFPLGCDFIFTCCAEVVCLPRSTKLEAA
ncbi:MAG: phosphonate C-P lyase system protein PhnH [Pseudomonadota bacterium]